jgi:chromosome partitioning protein
MLGLTRVEGLASRPVSTPPPLLDLEHPLVIAIANQQGGTGKTTTAINLAAALRRLGLPTLLIDMDQQANATSGLGVDSEAVKLTIYEVLHRDPRLRCTVDDAAVETDWGVMVVPGTEALIEIEESGDDAGREWRLRKALRKVAKPYIALIDCPPNLGRCTIISLTAADVVIAPVKPGVDELQALGRLEGTIDRLIENEVNEDLRLGGVLAVEFDGQSKLHRDTRVLLRERYGDNYLGNISKTVKVGESKGRQVPLVIANPTATAAMDYFSIAEGLKRRIMA